MKWSIVIASTLVVACSDAADRQQKTLMNRIETSVQLPADALPLNEYARYYSYDAQGDVSAVYYVHNADEIEFTKAVCSRGDVKDFPCGVPRGTLRLVRNGKRAWMESPKQFPAMSGGGCDQVDIHYRVQDDRIDSVECNGPY